MSNKQIILRVFKYLKPYRFLFCFGTFFYTSQQFIFPLINSIYIGGVTAAILNSSFSEVMTSTWLMLILLLTSAFLIGLGVYLNTVNIAYAVRDMSIDLFNAFIKTSIESQKHSGEGIAALNTDIDTASGIIDRALSSFLMSVIAASFSTVAVFIIDWRMGFGALAVGLLAFFAQSRFAAPLARLGKARLESNAESVKSLSNILAGALAIKAFNRQDRALIQFDRESGKLKKLAFKQAFIGMWQDLFTTVQGWLTIIVVFALGGWLAVAGEIDLALIMMVFPLAGAVSSAMSQIGTVIAGFQPPIVAARRVFDVIDSASISDEASQTSREAQNLSPCFADWSGKYDVVLNSLSFSYKDASTEALKEISLSIAENKMIAFVGESGSSKSTLLRIITGMYERSDLDMKLGDLSFTSDCIYDWRSHFAYVDQSCKLFDMSIAENIAMGVQGDVSEADIQEAAKRAMAHDFISELPEGYATSCGEKGASLSGGQKQRIAIARALCRKAPVLVFDEATSALDPESERGIIETIEDLRNDHTVLITSHHLHTITSADLIVVLDDGRIAEQGTHAQLIEKSGIYKRLLEESTIVTRGLIKQEEQLHG